MLCHDAPMGTLTFVGTGEAFDPDLPNTSLLWRGTRTLLFDCGYRVPHALWALSRDPDLLDGIYVTHPHADHSFGLPALLLSMRLEGRTRPLTVLGGPGVGRWLDRLCDLGYPGMLGKSPFPVLTAEVSPRRPLAWQGVALSVARTDHPVRNLAVRVQDGATFAYSGDGAPTPASLRLFRDVDLLVHEAFWLETPPPGASKGHASVRQALGLAAEVGARRLAVVHVAKELRARAATLVAASVDPPALLPRPGDTVEV